MQTLSACQKWLWCPDMKAEIFPFIPDDIYTPSDARNYLTKKQFFSSSVEVKVGGWESFPMLVQIPLSCQRHLRDASALHVCPKKPFFLFFNSPLENKRSHGSPFFCERMKYAIMQVLRVDVVCCTLLSCVTVVNCRNWKQEIFLFFVVNLSVARCWECSVGNESVVVEADMPYHF